ncbi:proline-rich protein 36-like [Pan paniscus]|uniref:proline-rich protein 36-like n=1 Tax=Pan paniscus TaxID=9597 RepID=UPI002436FC11|nr:proline-rich protein 36-like [Pan paniscus]
MEAGHTLSLRGGFPYPVLSHRIGPINHPLPEKTVIPASSCVVNHGVCPGCSEPSKDDWDPCLASQPISSPLHLRPPLQSLDCPRVDLPPTPTPGSSGSDAQGWGTQGSAEADSSIQMPLFLFTSLLPCHWPQSSQPAHQPSPLPNGWQVPLPASPLHAWPSAIQFLLVSPESRAWHGTGWGPSAQLSHQPPAPCNLPFTLLLSCPRPSLALYLLTLSLLSRPSNSLPTLSLAPHLPCPLPISSPLLYWPFSPWVSGFISRWAAGSLFSPPLSSSLSSSPFSLPPPASTPSPAHSPSPSPAAPPFSPTSLFQLRTSSSGQFPHCSASGEETAPLRPPLNSQNVTYAITEAAGTRGGCP